MTYIKVIQPEEAEGELKEIYDHLLKSRGKLAEVHKIQSLNPKSIVNHMDLYMTIMFGKSPLRRYQREMMAVVVSIANNCEYCQEHHAKALFHFWKDEEKIKKLKEDHQTAGLDPVDKALCDFARKLTKTPEKITEPEINQLKQTGLDDKAILDANLVIAYFNFVNRMVLGLGAELEENAGGYRYD